MQVAVQSWMKHKSNHAKQDLYQGLKLWACFCFCFCANDSAKCLLDGVWMSHCVLSVHQGWLLFFCFSTQLTIVSLNVTVVSQNSHHNSYSCPNTTTTTSGHLGVLASNITVNTDVHYKHDLSQSCDAARSDELAKDSQDQNKYCPLKLKAFSVLVSSFF